MFSKLWPFVFLLITTFPTFSKSISKPQQKQKKEYTSEEKAKLKQAEELADRFVQRWHETLDLNVLFDEFYTKDIGILNAKALWLIELTAQGSDKEIEGYQQRIIDQVGAEEIQHRMFQFANLLALAEEGDLALGKDFLENKNDTGEKDPKIEKLKELGEKLEAKDKETGQGLFDEFWCVPNSNQACNEGILTLKLISSWVKEFLPSTIFAEAAYQKAFAEKYSSKQESEVINWSSDYEKMFGVSSDTHLFQIQRGVFTLLIMEKNNQFKVLMAMPPLDITSSL